MVPKAERRPQKPLTERKRRARINKCLEQLKDVVIDNNGGILHRLDKARILELTVLHLKTISFSRTKESVEIEKFKAGYLRCLNEVSEFLHDRTDDNTLSQVLQHLFTQNIQSKNSSQVFKDSTQGVDKEPTKSFVSNASSSVAFTHNLDHEPVESIVPNSNISKSFKHGVLDQEPITSFVSNLNSSEAFKHGLDQEPVKSFVSNLNSSEAFKHGVLDQVPIKSFVSNLNSSEAFKHGLDQEPVKSFVLNSNGSEWFKHGIEQEAVESFVSNSSSFLEFKHCVLDQEAEKSSGKKSYRFEDFKQNCQEQELFGSFISNSNISETVNERHLDRESVVLNLNCLKEFKHSFLEHTPIDSSEMLNHSVYNIGHTTDKHIADQNISNNIFVCSSRYMIKNSDSDGANLCEGNPKSLLVTSCKEYSTHRKDSLTNEKDCCKISVKCPSSDIESNFCVDKTINCSTHSCQIIWRPW